MLNDKIKIEKKHRLERKKPKKGKTKHHSS